MNLEQMYGTLVTTMSSKNIFYDWEGVNTWLFQQIYSIRGDAYDWVMQVISDLAMYRRFPYYLVLLGVYSLLSYLVMKLRNKGGSKQFLSMWLGIFTVLLVSFAINAELLGWIKDYFAYPRPYAVLDGVNVLDKSLNASAEADRSFPSGHVAFITLMIMSLWPLLASRGRFVGLCLIAVVAWSRSALGAHFPADTLYGFIYAALLVVIVREIVYGIYHKLLGLNC